MYKDFFSWLRRVVHGRTNWRKALGGLISSQNIHGELLDKAAHSLYHSYDWDNDLYICYPGVWMAVTPAIKFRCQYYWQAVLIAVSYRENSSQFYALTDWFGAFHAKSMAE